MTNLNAFGINYGYVNVMIECIQFYIRFECISYDQIIDTFT